MIDAVRDSPCSVLAARQKPLIFRQFNSGIKFALESCHGGLDQVTLGRRQDRTPQPRGRPSVVAQFAAQISQWLRENPTVSGIEILRRAQLAGYRGGKSALYDLVKRLRMSPSIKTTASSSEQQTGEDDISKK